MLLIRELQWRLCISHTLQGLGGEFEKQTLPGTTIGGYS